jgi:hypothetical protein
LLVVARSCVVRKVILTLYLPSCATRNRGIEASLANSTGRVAHAFAFFLLTNTHDWMIPLQYVNAEGLV